MSRNKANRRPSAWQSLFSEDSHYAMSLLSTQDIFEAFCTTHLYQSLDLPRNSDIKKNGKEQPEDTSKNL